MTTQEKETYQTDVSVKDLLESGVHFGHQKRRCNPKMRQYVYEERNGIHILDLSKTIQQLRKACLVVRDIVAKKKSVLFVGTKKQAKTVIKEVAEACGEFYVAERWLGGMLTNLVTIRQSIKKLEKMEKKLSIGGDGLTKKEISKMTKLQEKLERNLEGVRAMRKPPGLVVVVDPHREHIAVAEARKLGIPVMAVADTNCDPDLIDYVIAGNDDALKSNKVLLEALANAIRDKKESMGVFVSKEEKEEKASDEETKE